MEEEQPYAVAAIRLLVFTGCRKSEILTLQWNHVDLDGGVLNLPDSKGGARSIALNNTAKDLLASLSPVDDNPYVIPGRYGKGRLVGLQRIWDRIRQEAQLPDVQVHDLRRTFASIGASSGVSLSIVSQLLGHKSQATTRNYSFLFDDEARDAANKIGDYINRNGKPEAE